MNPLLMAALGVDLLTFVLMGIDKAKAGRGRWRISEKTLFLFALLGGALGGTLGMMVFHHKTRKWTFAYGLPLLAIAQLLAILALKTKGIF